MLLGLAQTDSVSILGDIRALGQEGLVLAPDKVVEALQAGLSPHHLEPGATKGVVDQELDDVARGEELVADRKLAAVARSLTRLAHGATFILAVEVLVDPADGLVFDPDRGELGRVQDLEQVMQGRATGP